MSDNSNTQQDLYNSNEELNSLRKRRFELDIQIKKALEDRLELEESVKKIKQQHTTVKQRFNREQLLKERNKKELKKINSSRSWKLSKPVRKIGGLLKGKKQVPTTSQPSKKEIIQDKKRNSGSLNLERKLWGGFSTYALQELNDLKNSSQTSINEKIRASLVLARWYYDQGDYQEAFNQLEYMNEVRPLDNPNHDRTILEIKVMKKLGEINLAKRRVWDAIDVRGLLSELSLSMAHLAEDDSERLNWYNLVYDKYGYNLISKIDDNNPLDLENIRTTRTKVDSDLERYKISIIIPAYNAADLIHIALESLLNQTLQNLDIIVVDDCSPDNTSEVVQEYVKRDKRVKLIRKEVNQGAYAARNTGLQQATGDFITIHDGDDWSHSQKLEVQLRAILNNPGSVGSISHLVRATKDITPLNGGSLLSKKFIMANASSLLVSRDVFTNLGGWDSVRVAGDTEFHWRIEQIYGKDSVIQVEPKVPFSIALSNEKSLTGTSTTHVKTIRYGLRRTYREAFMWWHSKATSPEQLYMDPKKLNRHFPCPVTNRVNRPVERNYDLVIIGDYSSEDSIKELELIYSKLKSLDKKVAIFHWPFYEENPEYPVSDVVFQFVDEMEIDILVANEELTAKQMVVIHPNVLKYSLDSVPIIHSTSSYIVMDESLTAKQRSLIEENLDHTMSLKPHWTSMEELLASL